MLKYFITGYILAVLAAILILGPRGTKFEQPPRELFNDMDRQSKVKYQDPSDFFADGRAARLPVPGTVPLGFAKPWEAPEDPNALVNRLVYNTGQNYLSTGRIDGNWGDGIPEEYTVDTDFLKRGMERYDINCKVCHGATGAGNGVATNYGVLGVANLQTEAFVNQPDGQIYNTIANGKGLMFGYGANLTLRDRWAIVAYVRALQLAQTGTLEDLTEEQRAELAQKTAAAQPVPAEEGETPDGEGAGESPEAETDTEPAPDAADQASLSLTN